MGVIFVAGAILAQCSIYNTYIASGSRGFFSLADDHLAPPVLVKCDKKHGVPYISVLSVGIFNLLFCMFPFGFIIVLDVSLLIASYAMVYISAMILRKKNSERRICIQNSWRIRFPLPDMHSSYLRSTACILHQRFRLLPWRYGWYSFRSCTLLHLEKKIRRTYQEGF